MGKEEGKTKIGKTIDRIVMGLIIGGAIGSVLGLTLAPKPGKETRKYLSKKGEEIFKKGKESGEKLIETHRDQIKEIGNLTKETARGVLSLLKNWIFKKKKTSKYQLGKGELKKLPDESIQELPSENEEVKGGRS